MVIAAQYGTVSDIEIMWTLLAAVSVIFGIFNYVDARADRAAARLSKVQNGRKVIANFAVYNELLRLGAQSIFVLIGVLAMLVPNRENVTSLPWQTIAVSAAVTWGIIIASGLLMAQSVYSYFIRKQLLS